LLTHSFLTGTIATLQRLAARQELKLDEAANFVEKPFAGETIYPFTETWAPSASLTSRKRKRADSDDETPKGTDITLTGCEKLKFSQQNSSFNNIFSNNNLSCLLPPEMQSPDWNSSLKTLSVQALSSNTWHKYFASLTKFQTYLLDTKQTLSWPIKESVINGFILWCEKRKNIQPQSVKAYIFGLSKIQQFLGFGKIKFCHSISEDLLKGWEHKSKTKSVRKGKMNLKILKEIRKLAKQQFNDYNFRTIWAACCLAFFTSCRMGELLAEKKTLFGLDSTLLWSDVVLKNSKLKITLKTSKTSNQPEKLYLFSIPNKKFCPVKALNDLKFLQLKNNMFADSIPVFRLDDNLNLTKSFLNKWFAKNRLNISAHSFRNAIPTLLAKHPDLATDEHIKIWGRWRSNAFTTYQRADAKQRKWLYQKIIKLLF
jgi:hypothetical protein